MMQAGDLSQRIIIQQKARVAVGGGNYTETWPTFARVWARVLPVRGDERTQGDQIEARTMYRITINRREDLTEEVRISWKGKIMNIRFIALKQDSDQFMTIDATAGVAT